MMRPQKDAVTCKYGDHKAVFDNHNQTWMCTACPGAFQSFLEKELKYFHEE